MRPNVSLNTNAGRPGEFSEPSPADLSLPVFYGRSEPAVYQESPLAAYRGNPLIEALPPILLAAEAAQNLAYYPEFEDQERLLPAELRFHLIQEVLDFFEPFPIHLDLEQRFSRIIRRGYKARNPLRPGDWSRLNRKLQVLSGSSPQPLLPSTAAGFTLLGLSGVGKSTAVERILSLYAQVLFHQAYHDRPLSLVQLVWLKLDCPPDGSTRGLCLSFFQAIDQRLGTNYYQNYANNGNKVTVDSLLPQMARLSWIHRIGVLVVDEIQNLSLAKSGGAAQMLNFFVYLVNTLGLPVVLIGTPKARQLLTREFRQARRSTGQGDPIWNNMAENELWQLFLESLWRYQYVRNPSQLTPELSHTLYDETQGITDFAVKIFMLAQIRAIVTGQETLTSAIIRSVAAESLCFAAPALSALRTGNRYALQQFEDLQLLDLDPCLEQALIDLRSPQPPTPSTDPLGPQTRTLLATELEPQQAVPIEVPPQSQAVSSSQRRGSKGAERSRVFSQNDIRQIVSREQKQDVPAYQAIRAAGLTCPATEYLGGEAK